MKQRPLPTCRRCGGDDLRLRPQVGVCIFCQDEIERLNDIRLTDAAIRADLLPELDD